MDVSTAGNKIKWKRPLFIFALFAACVLMACWVRTVHYNKAVQAIRFATGKDFVPFTVESAMMYSYAHDVATGKGVPRCDKGLLGMEDIPVRGQMSLGLEYFTGWGYRLKNLLWKSSAVYPDSECYEDDPDFTVWARFQIRLWVSVASGLIFLWLIVLRCPWHLALIGGLTHAFSPAAVARYTGQDLLRGEFCLPLLVASFLLAAWAFRRASFLRLMLLGIAVFCAISTWDMCQVCFSLWAVFEIVRILAGGSLNSKRRNVWIVVYIALVMAAVLVPYHRTHGLIVSPLILLLAPTILSLCCFASAKKYSRRWAVFGVSAIVLFFAWKIAGQGASYSGNYSHFAELVKAKLAHGNVKPSDPTKLNFAARMLWTPALHSATWKMTRLFFPSVFWAFAGAFIFAFPFANVRKKVLKGLSRSFFPIFMTFVFFITYVYMVRFHVFCVVFLCVAFPLLVYDWSRAFKSVTPKIIVFIIALFFLGGEADLSLRLERSYNNIGSAFREYGALIRWFRQSGLKDKAVLADMTLSPLLKAYCGARILLQPKFELGRTRKLVEEYINIMFHGTEEDLNKYCVKHGIEFIVYDYGYSYRFKPHIYTNRYMAAADLINKKSPAYRFSNYPDESKWFYRIEPPRDLKDASNLFIVFKVISPKDRINSMKCVIKGEMALKYGQTSLAKRYARIAFYNDPCYIPGRDFFAAAYGYIPNIKLSDYK